MRQDLRDWLREKNLTQAQLADEIGMTYNYVATICRGDVAMSPLFRLRFMASYGFDPATVAQPVTSEQETQEEAICEPVSA